MSKFRMLNVYLHKVVARTNIIKRTNAKSANPRKIDAIKIKTPRRKEKIETI